MLEVTSLTKRFGGLTALRNISLSVKQGEIVGLIGPNGAGKTTLFNTLTGFVRRDLGKIVFLEEDVSSLTPEKLCQKGLCRTFQIVRPFGNISVLDNVLVGALNCCKSIDEARDVSKKVISFVGLDDFRNQHANKLTLGYRKRLEVARALATGPKLLLLDEVMAGLNPTEVKKMIELVFKIYDSGVTLLIIEHIMEAIMSTCSRIIVLNYGEKLAEGSPSEVSTNPEVIQAYLGVEHEFA